MKAVEEIAACFTQEMAHSSYVAFCHLSGHLHLERHLRNEPLVRQLCEDYEKYSLIHPQGTASSKQGKHEPDLSSYNLDPSSSLSVNNAANPSTTLHGSPSAGVLGNRISVTDDDGGYVRADPAGAPALKQPKDNAQARQGDGVRREESVLR